MKNFQYYVTRGINSTQVYFVDKERYFPYNKPTYGEILASPGSFGFLAPHQFVNMESIPSGVVILLTMTILLEIP